MRKLETASRPPADMTTLMAFDAGEHEETRGGE